MRKLYPERREQRVCRVIGTVSDQPGRSEQGTGITFGVRLDDGGTDKLIVMRAARYHHD